MGSAGRSLSVSLSILTAAAILLTACGDMTQGELDRRIGTVSSIAAEGSILARQVADDRTKTTFARVRSRELAEDVDHELEKTADATPADGQVKRRDEFLDLAVKVGEALDVIQTHPEDEKRAADAESDLEGLAQLLRELEERK